MLNFNRYLKSSFSLEIASRAIIGGGVGFVYANLAHLPVYQVTLAYTIGYCAYHALQYLVDQFEQTHSKSYLFASALIIIPKPFVYLAMEKRGLMGNKFKHINIGLDALFFSANLFSLVLLYYRSIQQDRLYYGTD